MAKRICIILILCLLLSSRVFAADKVVPNNKFGIHLAQPDPGDLKKAAELVNVSGGKWGYVTLVLQENDRDHNKWQGIFDQLRELHLIPIIRLATHPDPPAGGASWRRPDKEDLDGWVSFLDGLNWVVKKRYIILFNEPNHGSEWGGSVDPAGYTTIAQLLAQKFYEKNLDYVVMLAGLDASAPNGGSTYMDEADFLQIVIAQITPAKFNELFDGLASHSYPNPGFAGSPIGIGRGSVRTYEWELDLLKSLGVKDLPVFITETGWDANALSRDAIAKHFQFAYLDVWLPDERVIAVTPFILNYQSPPFTSFSWAMPGNGAFYPQYYLVQSLEKVRGAPAFDESGVLSYELPRAFVVNSKYYFQLKLRNAGQAIWDKDEGYHLVIDGYSPDAYFFTPLHHIKPNGERVIDFWIETPRYAQFFDSHISLYRDKDKVLSGPAWKFEIVPLPSLEFSAKLHPKWQTNGEDFEIHIFDNHEKLVFDQKHVKVAAGKGAVREIQNIALGAKYRVVILKPYYLPRQKYMTFKKGINQLAFYGMYPLDFNNDGALWFGDVWALLLHSINAMRRLWFW